MAETTSADETTRQLCLRCGICCNGVLFRDVELQAGDDPARLRTLGMILQERGRRAKPRNKSVTTEPGPARWRLPQPCAALGPDCRCRVYAERPQRCRAFECALFQKVQAGQQDVPAALDIIRSTLRQAEQVKALLRQLGDSEETLALSLRFQRLRRVMGTRSLTEESAALYAELTLAVHDLNLMLGREFHP